MIAGSDKGSDTNPCADLDKDEDQAEENWAPRLQSVCAKASVFALVQHLRCACYSNLDHEVDEDAMYLAECTPTLFVPHILGE